MKLYLQVSIPSELAVLIVSALEDLTRAKVSGHLERLTDLFEKAQQQVLNDMVPYWRKFCKMYHSPLDSTDSLPQGKISLLILKYQIQVIFVHSG